MGPLGCINGCFGGSTERSRLAKQDQALKALQELQGEKLGISPELAALLDAKRKVAPTPQPPSLAAAAAPTTTPTTTSLQAQAAAAAADHVLVEVHASRDQGLHAPPRGGEGPSSPQPASRCANAQPAAPAASKTDVVGDNQVSARFTTAHDPAPADAASSPDRSGRGLTAHTDSAQAAAAASCATPIHGNVACCEGVAAISGSSSSVPPSAAAPSPSRTVYDGDGNDGAARSPAEPTAATAGLTPDPARRTTCDATAASPAAEGQAGCMPLYNSPRSSGVLGGSQQQRISASNIDVPPSTPSASSSAASISISTADGAGATATAAAPAAALTTPTSSSLSCGNGRGLFTPASPLPPHSAGRSMSTPCSGLPAIHEDGPSHDVYFTIDAGAGSTQQQAPASAGAARNTRSSSTSASHVSLTALQLLASTTTDTVTDGTSGEGDGAGSKRGEQKEQQQQQLGGDMMMGSAGATAAASAAAVHGSEGPAVPTHGSPLVQSSRLGFSNSPGSSNRQQQQHGSPFVQLHGLPLGGAATDRAMAHGAGGSGANSPFGLVGGRACSSSTNSPNIKAAGGGGTSYSAGKVVAATARVGLATPRGGGARSVSGHNPFIPLYSASAAARPSYPANVYSSASSRLALQGALSRSTQRSGTSMTSVDALGNVDFRPRWR